MTMPRCCLAVLLACAPVAAAAQDSLPVSTAPPAAANPQPGLMTLTIFLRHDESQTLGEINDRLRRQHYFESFPPEGVEVLSWTVVMGIGQVVTLRFPAERLREVNRAIEQTPGAATARNSIRPTIIDRPRRRSARACLRPSDDGRLTKPQPDGQLR